MVVNICEHQRDREYHPRSGTLLRIDRKGQRTGTTERGERGAVVIGTFEGLFHSRRTDYSNWCCCLRSLALLIHYSVVHRLNYSHLACTAFVAVTYTVISATFSPCPCRASNLRHPRLSEIGSLKQRFPTGSTTWRNPAQVHGALSLDKMPTDLGLYIGHRV